MRTLNILGLAALATVALAAGAVSASATTLTSPAGNQVKAGAVLKASSEQSFQLHTPINTYPCNGSKLTAEVVQEGNASLTVAMRLTHLSFFECTSGLTFMILQPGKLEIHTDSASADGNGIVTWSGASITTLTHTVVGDYHCKYHVKNVTFGTLTGSKNLGGKTATLNVGSVQLVPDEPSPWWYYCSEEVEGEEVGPTLTGGSYTIETPDYLDVD
jgi:hypothetical protein